MTEQIELPRLKKFTIENGAPRQRIWDTSSLSTFLACPRLYNYTNLQGYKSQRYASATGFGSAVHEGFEVLDRAKFEGKSKDVAVREALVFVLKEFGEDLKMSDDSARGLESTLRAIVWRAEEYWEDTFKVATMPNGEAALEQRFEVPFGNGEHRFSGRIDKIVTLDDRLYLVDFKTTKTALSAYYFQGFMPNNQIFAYLWACRHVLKLPVDGFIIDGVQTGVNFTRFNRSVFNVTEELIEEWYVDTLFALRNADNFWKNNYYPADFTGCGNYGGCRFREVCSAPQSRRDIFLKNDFVKEPHPDLVEASQRKNVIDLAQHRKNNSST